VILVLLMHYQMYFYPSYLVYPWTWCGQHGVTIFFVVSGYLITTNLLRNGDLKRFYIRRFSRLMPAAWTYLAVVLILAATTHRVTIGSDLWGCLFFFRNYQPTLHTYTGHFWSLSIEEQFYFVWPLLLLLLGKRKAAVLAGTGALAVAIYRSTHGTYMQQGGNLFFTTGIRIDAIMVGCLLGLAMSYPRIHLWITEHAAAIFWTCAPVLAFDLWRYQAVMPLHENIAIALMLASTMTNPRLLASRILEMPHLKRTGVFCYGIYLWQGLLLRSAFGAVGILLLPVAVLASWTLIEQPSQRLADWLLKKRASRDLQTAQAYAG
jgi:peptidoglycan/LPS O-acetylase OafA/YrhL